MAIEDTYGGENGGRLRRAGQFMRKWSKNIRHFGLSALIPFKSDVSEFTASTFGGAEITEGLTGNALDSAVKTGLENTPIIGTLFGGFVGAAAAVVTFIGNVLITTDDLLQGNFKESIKSLAAGTVETGAEVIAAGAATPFTPLWFLNSASMLFSEGNKHISTHLYDITHDIADSVLGEDKPKLQSHLPGINMASLSTNQAALAMTPAMAAVQPQMRAQPAPGYAPTYWTDRRAAELGMAPQQLAQRQGVGELNAAREARMAELAQEQAV